MHCGFKGKSPQCSRMKSNDGKVLGWKRASSDSASSADACLGRVSALQATSPWRRATAAALKSQIWACAHVAHKWMPSWRAGHRRYPSSSPFPWSVPPAGVASCRAASCARAAEGDYKLVTQGNTIIFGPGRAPLELYRLLKGALLFRACYKPQKAAG